MTDLDVEVTIKNFIMAHPNDAKALTAVSKLLKRAIVSESESLITEMQLFYKGSPKKRKSKKK